MAPSTGTPLGRKLGIHEGDRVGLIHAPDDWEIEGLPSGVRIARGDRPTAADVLVAFFFDLGTLQAELDRLARSIVPDGALWLAWPRRAAGHDSDITDNAIRAAALPLGVVDVKVAALGDHWSGLKMVWRKQLRPTLP